MKSTRETCADVLYAVLEEGAYANLLLNKALTDRENRRDRAFITNVVYGTLHRLTPVDYQIARFLKKPIRPKDRYLQEILRAAFFEILFTSAKPHGIVNEYVNLGKKRGNPGWGKMINGVLRGLLRQKEELSWPEFSCPGDKAAFFASIPSWLVNFWQKERGKDVAEQLILNIEEERYPVLRVNTLKTDRVALAAQLEEVGLPTIPGTLSGDALRTEKGADFRLIPEEMRSLYTVQEESSQLVAFVLDPREGDTVLDMCAAPGGKTTHLAQRMNNRGTIFASDIHAHKVKLIQENARRLGMTCIRGEEKDAVLWGKEYPQSFDAVLLDAPCSGLGVLNRRSDSRFHKDAGDIAALTEVQKKLLISAHDALKPGGRLVYSTCTLSCGENTDNFRWFLKKFPDMKPLGFDGKLPGLTEAEKLQAKEGYLELLPFSHQTDGFFISCFQKDIT